MRFIRRKANPRLRERTDKSSIAFWEMYLDHAKEELPNTHKKSVRRKIRKRVVSDNVVSAKDVNALLLEPVRFPLRSTKNRPDPIQPRKKTHAD
jgi:hypothetical protein